MKYSRPGWLHPSRLGEGQVIKAETVRARIKALQDCAVCKFDRTPSDDDAELDERCHQGKYECSRSLQERVGAQWSKRDNAVTFGPPLIEGKMSAERGEELETAVVAYGFDVKMFDHKSSGGWACDCGEYNAPATFCCGRCGRSR